MRIAGSILIGVIAYLFGFFTSSMALTANAWAFSDGELNDTGLVAVLLLFLVWPLLTGIYFSFTEYTTLTPPEWVGFENYRAMLADPVFWNSLKVTIWYVILNIGVQTVVALAIAVLMQRLTQSTILRSLVLAPYLVSNVVAAIVFLWILDTQLGIFNKIGRASCRERV